MRYMILAAALLTGCTPAVRVDSRVIVDPAIGSYQDELFDDLVHNNIDDYVLQDEFKGELEAYLAIVDYLGLEGDVRLLKHKERIPEELWDAYMATPRYSLKTDDFSGVKDLEGYILTNWVSFCTVMRKINASPVVLFGEKHWSLDHETMQLKMLEAMEGNVAYACEFFRLDQLSALEQFMEGKYESTRPFQMLFGAEKIRQFAEAVARRNFPIVPTDPDTSHLQFPRPVGDPREAYHVRDKVMAEQIAYAVEQDYLVRGHFGAAHTRPEHIPRFLREHGIDPLVITGYDFTRDVYDAAMRVSGGREIFFQHGDTIVYVAPDVYK